LPPKPGIAITAPPYQRLTCFKQGVQVQHKASKVLKLGAAVEAAPASATEGGAAKPIQHYLLLPAFEWGISEWHWSAALDYVKSISANLRLFAGRKPPKRNA